MVYTSELKNNILHIDIVPKIETDALNFTLDEENVSGLAFHLPEDAQSCVVTLGGKAINTVTEKEDNGKMLAYIPWRSLAAEQLGAVDAFASEFGEGNA